MLALSLIALLVVAPSARKCPAPQAAMPGYGLRELVVLIDGVILPRDSNDIALEQEDIESVWIRCWNPATSSFELDGIPLALVHTKKTFEATRAPLLQLVRAQEEFKARHQRYATDLASLVPFGLPEDVAFELEATESTWKASTPSAAVTYQCSANEGLARSAGADGQPKLDCVPVDTLALRSLRARFDAGR
jgi:hypothetical protein